MPCDVNNNKMCENFGLNGVNFATKYMSNIMSSQEEWAKGILTADRAQVMRFEVDKFRKYCLQNGLDEIGLTLQKSDKIRAFEAQRLAQYPWLAR